MHNNNFPSIQNQTFVCMFLRYKVFYFPKYSTSTGYIIGEYYIILIFATECRFGHALYNHLQERVKLLFSSENYLDSRSPTTKYCIIVLEKRNLSQKLRKVLNIESLRFMEIKECPNIKKRKKKKGKNKTKKKTKKKQTKQKTNNNIKHNPVV